MKLKFPFLLILLICQYTFAQNNIKIQLEERNPLDYELYRNPHEKSLKKEYAYLAGLQFFGFNYTSFDQLKIRGFMIQPKMPGKYPVIIFNRGGNQDMGTVSIQMMTNFLGKIAEKGYIIIGSQLRGSSLSQGKDEFGGKDVNDVLSLLDILKTLPNADASRIGMMGISRGVMTNFLVMKQTDVIKTCISISGIADLDQKNRPEIQLLYKELIPDFDKNPQLEMDKRSPVMAIGQMKNKGSSHYIIHGQKDERVDFHNAFQLYDALSQNNIAARLQIFENDNHGINAHTNELLQSITSWMNERL